jgi:DNA-binding MarR family transcriptional regulator
MQATSAPAQATYDTLTEDVGTFLLHLMKASSSNFFRAMAEHELSLTQIKVLYHLEDQDETESSIKALADQFAMSLAAMSRSVDALHQRGFVERREDEDDRRMKRVRISPTGAELVGRLTEMRLSQLNDFLSTLTDAQRKRLAAAIEPIVARPDVAASRPKGRTR